jgi:SAM-dependent methyltransferase
VSPEATGDRPLRARLATGQGEPEIGQERIAVYHPDGTVEEVRLHDYHRLYQLPGVYEQIVQEALGCRSPALFADWLVKAGAHDVIDIAAGNGVSGQALRDAGLHPVLGSDLESAARDAALRDRPDVYDEYLTLDLTVLTDAERDHLRALGADALCCVAVVGTRPEHLPPRALAAAAQGLRPGGLVIYMHDPRHGDPDPIDHDFWDAELLRRERYLHRFTVTGRPYEMDAVLWRMRG